MEKLRKCLVYLKTHFISIMYKLFSYNFWWNCIEFSDKMCLTIQMKMFNNVKQNYLNFIWRNLFEIWGQIFYFSNLIMFIVWVKLYNQRKFTFTLSYVFGICCCFHHLTCFNLSLKNMPLVIEFVNFATESLVFQNSLLNGARFIFCLKLPS